MTEAKFRTAADVVWLDPSQRGSKSVRYGQPKTVDLASISVFPQAPSSGSRGQIVTTGTQPEGQPPPEGELGSAFDRYRLFGFYDGGRIFQDPNWETGDLEAALKIDGKMKSMEVALTEPLRMGDYAIKGKKGDKGELEFIQSVFAAAPDEGGMRTPFRSVLDSMTIARLLKRSHFERVYKRRDDGKLVYDKLPYRPPMTCYLARWAGNGEFAGFMQWTWKADRPDQDGRFQRILIPEDRAFVHMHGTWINPLEGRSDLELAYQVHITKQKLRYLWLNYLEELSLPRAKAMWHSTDEEEASEFADTAAELRRGGIIPVPKGADLVPYAPRSGSSESEYHMAMAYLDSEQSGSIMAGFLDLTGAAAHLARGSMALSQDQSQLYLQLCQAGLKEIDATVSYGSPDGCAGLFSDLCRWNFPDPKVPTLEHGSLQQADIIDKTTTLLNALAVAPTSQLPYAFIDQIMVKAAGYLGLDMDEIAKAVTAAAHKPSDTPAETLAARAGNTAPLPGVPRLPGMTDQSANLHAAVARAYELVRREEEAIMAGAGTPNGSIADAR